jgi:hypothetical protein
MKKIIKKDLPVSMKNDFIDFCINKMGWNYPELLEEKLIDTSKSTKFIKQKNI